MQIACTLIWNWLSCQTNAYVTITSNQRTPRVLHSFQSLQISNVVTQVPTDIFGNLSHRNLNDLKLNAKCIVTGGAQEHLDLCVWNALEMHICVTLQWHINADITFEFLTSICGTRTYSECTADARGRLWLGLFFISLKNIIFYSLTFHFMHSHSFIIKSQIKICLWKYWPHFMDFKLKQWWNCIMAEPGCDSNSVLLYYARTTHYHMQRNVSYRIYCSRMNENIELHMIIWILWERKMRMKNIWEWNRMCLA